MSHLTKSIVPQLSLTAALAVALATCTNSRAQNSPAAKQPADQPSISAQSNDRPLGTLSPQEREAVSLAAGRVLLHADLARQEADAGEPAKAARDVDQALLLVRILDEAVPEVETSTTIHAGKLTYEDKRTHSQRYVPIFDDLVAADVIGPVLRAKAGREERAAESKAAAATKDAANEAADDVAVEASDFLTVSSARLDMLTARQLLEAARKSLAAEKPDTGAASTALLDLEASCVRFEFEALELPLSEAIDNLQLAEQEFGQGHCREARATLGVAADALQRYGEQDGVAHAKEAEKLRQEIEGFRRQLDVEATAEAATKEAVAKAKEWWNRIGLWGGKAR